MKDTYGYWMVILDIHTLFSWFKTGDFFHLYNVIRWSIHSKNLMRKIARGEENISKIPSFYPIENHEEIFDVIFKSPNERKQNQ